MTTKMATETEKISKKINGGARPGAGRKKGSPNKKTAAVQKAVAESGVTPLDYLLSIMRQPIPEDATLDVKVAIQGQQFEAAKAAAPYVHAKLASIEHAGKEGLPITVKIIDYSSMHNPKK